MGVTQQAGPGGRFQYRGNLAETPLPEMLYTIARFRVPGIIQARREEVLKEIYLWGGYVVHATSSDLEESLGAYLRQIGRLTPREFTETMSERRHSDQRYGVLLVEKGLLAPNEVFHSICKQIEAVVWSLFYWREGEVTFRLGEFKKDHFVQLQLPLLRVIFEGIRRAPEAKPMLHRIGGRETVLKPSYHPEDGIEIGLDADEFRLLRLVDGSRTLYELCSMGPFAAAENAKVLYAFRVLHLVDVVDSSGQEAGTADAEAIGEGAPGTDAQSG